jgi:hypothetical protein
MSVRPFRMNPGVKVFMLLLPCLLLIGGATTSRGPDDPCTLFTQGEIKTLLGVAVEAGSSAIAGCQWASADYEATAQIQIIEDTSYYEPHKDAKGYQELTGVGLYGWSGFELGSWVASSNTGRFVLLTMVTSPKSDRDTAIKFLGMLLERVK